MSTELAPKKRVRVGHRASTRRFLGQVDTAIASVPLDVAKITQLKRSLDDQLKVLNILDEEILTLTPEDAIEGEIIQADEVRELIYTALSRLELALKPLPAPTVRTERLLDHPVTEPPVEPTDPATEEAHDLTTEARSRSTRVRLTKITLPRFNGDPVRWMSFWDSYQSTVQLNSELTDVDKFNCLLSLLDHSAYDAIAGLTLSSANYKQAIEILRKRFGNTQVIISKHMDTLMSMDPISSDRHLNDLRRLYDHTESHVRSLRSLGIEAASYGALLSPVLLAKLPPDLRLIVSRKVSNSNLDMDALLSTFEEELTARERANPQLTQRTVEKPHHTSSALFTGTRNSKVEPQCCYCQQSHPSTSCTSVTNPADRKQSFKTSGRCFNCPCRSHVSRNCKSSSRCQKCNKKHQIPSLSIKCFTDSQVYWILGSDKELKTHRHLASVLNHFWRRWRSEYLNELRESHRHGAKNARNTHIAAGEVVIVHDDSLPRGLWKLGRIQEVIPGADGLPRSALVRVASRDRQHTLLKRPVQLLYPLEISQPEHLDNTPGGMTSAQPQPDKTPATREPVTEPLETCEPVRRPVRVAVKKAAERRRVWVEELQNQN